MKKGASEYFRYLAVNPLDQVWGISATGAGYQPVEAGGDPIPRRGHPPGHFYTWDAGRVLSEHAVVYVTHGRGEFDSRETGRVPLAAGDAVLLFPGVWHRYRPVQACGWGIYWIHFQGDLAGRLREDGVFSAAHAVLHVGIDEELLAAFRGILDALRAEANGCSLIAAAKTMEILARLKTAASPSRPVPRLQAIVREAQLLLEEDPGGLPVVDELIKRFDVSRTHFFRAFKRQTGQSPYKYHLQLTVRRAGEMLRNSPLSVKEIAASLGFGSPYHFSKLFKSKTGSSPTAYRRQWREAAGASRIKETPAVPGK